MDFRFTAHNPETGAFLHRLPRAEQVQIGDTFGTRGTLELTFSAKTLNAKPMPTFVEIRQEATFDGGMTWAPIGPNYLRLSGSHEDTDQAGMRTVKFVSREWLLGKARVGNGDLPLIDNKRPFYQSSPGTILRTLILEAKDRGAAQGIEIGGFTGARDSSGNAWSKVTTIYYSPGLPVLNVLENLVEQGMCDYRMEGNTLHLFEPETTMGQDHTTGTNPVRVHGAVTEAPISYTLEELTTSALLIGEDGFKLEVDNPTAPDDYGRLEVTIEQGGVNQEGTARIMVDEALNRGSREIREITRTQHAEGLKFLPYRDYRVGDFVQVRDQGQWERYRVREIQAVRDGDGWTVHTVINDRLQELLLKLAKRTSGIVNGSTGSGGDGTQPAPPAKPGIEPAAPEGLVIDQQVYLDRQGVARGAVTAGWGEVTQSTRGEAIEIGGYELWWRENETLAVWRRASSVVDSLTVTHSPVVLSDTFGNAMEYQWRVRAVAEASARPGPWSDSVTLTMTQDTEPPNTPSMPGVSTDLRIITVDIDGLDEFGESMPVDFNHTRIYFGTAKNMADAVRVGSLTQPGMWNSGSMDPDVPVWVAVSAVDNVGNESAMTEAQSVTPKKLVDDDSIRDELGTIDDKIADAKQAAIDESVVTAGGVTVHNKTTTPVDSPSDKEHDVWQQWTTLEEGGTLVAAWLHDGTEWVKRSIVEEYVPRINIGEGTFGEMSGSRLSANSVTADKLIVGRLVDLAPSPARYPDEWSLNKGAFVFDWGAAYDGAGIRLVPGGSEIFGPFRDTEPGEVLWLAAYAGRYSGAIEDARLRAAFYTADGSYLTNRVAQTGIGHLSGTVTAPDGAVSARVWIDSSPTNISEGWISVRDIRGRQQASATLIQDGAITTDKILANAITAGKIAALAIEADHISANAITADKIHAGAIDSMLITGARIRTAASGARVELNSEGLKAYRSNGAVVLNTDTSDGSIDMTGNLSQTRGGTTIGVGYDYNGGPGIQWSDSNIYAFPPGIRYGDDPDVTGRKSTLVQGPGVTGGNSFLSLYDRGKGFALIAWQGTGGSRTDWAVDASLADNSMRVGSSTSDAPYMRMERGSGGETRAQYSHPSNGGFASMVLQDRDIFLGTSDSNGNVVSRLWGDADSTELTAGTRSLYLRGKDVSVNADSKLYFPGLPPSSSAVPIGRDGNVCYISSSRKSKLIEEPIESTVESLEDRLLSVDAKTWVDRGRAEMIADQQTAIVNGQDHDDLPEGMGGLERIPGVVAEDMIDAGLDLFVHFDEAGDPMAVMYDRIGPALIPIIRRLRDRVDALETKLGATA